MFFYLPLFFRSLVFFAGLELLRSFDEWGIFIVFLLAAFTAYTSYTAGGKRLFFVTVPVLFTLGVYLILFLIDSISQKQLFIIISSFVYYMVLFGTHRLKSAPKDKTAQGMIAFTDMITVFFLFSGIYGIYLNFTFPLWSFMLSYCFSAVAVSYHYFYFLSEDKRLVWVYSLILGLSMAEIAWMLNFWPFGYLTTGVVALIFYYMQWYMVRNHLLHILVKKQMLIHIVAFFLLVIAVLVSSRWLPVV